MALLRMVRQRVDRDGGIRGLLVAEARRRILPRGHSPRGDAGAPVLVDCHQRGLLELREPDRQSGERCRQEMGARPRIRRRRPQRAVRGMPGRPRPRPREVRQRIQDHGPDGRHLLRPRDGGGGMVLLLQPQRHGHVVHGRHGAVRLRAEQQRAHLQDRLEGGPGR